MHVHVVLNRLQLNSTQVKYAAVNCKKIQIITSTNNKIKRFMRAIVFNEDEFKGQKRKVKRFTVKGRDRLGRCIVAVNQKK